MRLGIRVGGAYISGGFFFWMLFGPVMLPIAVVVIVIKAIAGVSDRHDAGRPPRHREPKPFAGENYWGQVAAVARPLWIAIRLPLALIVWLIVNTAIIIWNTALYVIGRVRGW